MYFKRLELVGFKSFFDKTTLHFEPGITAVVGPNGCGKSNIFDSIRWVLGEQSAKSLRGSDMQDVIFNGTDNKDALGMAEVTLAFDNRTRFFDFDHDEVAITRRLFRSGESEYLLNKNTVRLKDIADLLLGTGVGAESYSIVAQGKIDLVLSSKPEERRMVFDEASGITKYKAQKREAERKFEETEQNLLRVNDIIAEVKRQIGSLERQANKARKYKEAFEELKVKEINSSILQKKELIRQKDEIIRKLKEMEVKETELLDLIRKQEDSIAARQSELRILEERMMEVRNQVLNLDNLIVRNNEHISFNKERLIELDSNRSFLETQIEEVRGKIVADEENLNNVRQEYDGLRKNIEEKSQILSQREAEINNIACAIKASLDNISDTKRQIMELASKISGTKNQIADFNNKQHVFVARKKRLETEKAKVYEEKVVTETNLTNITQEVENIKNALNEVSEKIASLKNQIQQENSFLSNVNIDIDSLDKQRLSLESHKEFLVRLKTKYEDISESMNAVIYLDKPPQENMSGLVIKIKEYSNLNEEDSARLGISGLKISGEAKPIELDTQKIDDKIAKILEILEASRSQKQVKETQIGELNNALNLLLQDLRNQELALANRETSRSTIAEQFNKINQEEDIIVIELSDVNREVSVIEANILVCEGVLNELNNEQKKCEDSIQQEESSISLNSKLREDVLVVITQTKTELDGLNSRLITDEETLKILEDTYRREKESIENIDKQIKDSIAKKDLMEQEIRECEVNVVRFNQEVLEQNNFLKEFDGKYREISLGSSDAVKQIEADRKTLDELKNALYEFQMQDKDIDYKYATLKDRLIQAYKTDLDSCEDLAGDIDAAALAGEINVLKQRLDSYGNVNLVAIEEYDELKQRYDFLIQQMTDLTTSKEALHQAILKINRTTKQMFVETFEKVKEEFRNYFRMLFNGGDAQLFLTDESDPLESGIEIICRPPGKKLQNVLLLSGGEKSMSAIALIFAIFKVKPSPFCILDEIDAALDEANVDRFSRMLHQFSKTSQFIVITHNKRTIANANVMYGITMEQSGVSKIVSVKFAETKQNQEVQPQQPATSQN